jgi:hypothetical protein
MPKIDAQEYFPNNESIHSKNNNYTAFTNAKFMLLQTKLSRNGFTDSKRIIAVGKQLLFKKMSQ